MREIKAPFNIPNKGKKIFLAGSIEMGKAEDWQTLVVNSLKDTDWIILNPRRSDWDSSWKQDKNNPQFREQVEWELQGLEEADVILFYFDKDTKSPITLLELGMSARRDLDFQKILVVCPEGFYRKGNVDLVCERYGVKQYPDLAVAIKEIRNLI